MNKLLLTTLLLTTGLMAQTFHVATTPEFRTALQNAAQNGEDDTIVLADGTYTTTDDGKGTFEYLDNEVYDLTLSGSDSKNVILDGAQQHRIFRHDSLRGAELRLEKLTFTNGGASNDDTDNGGGFFANKAAVTIVDCNFSNNQAVNGGGFFMPYENFGSVTIINSVFENNSARKNDYASDSGLGGGFYSRNCSFVDINNSSFIGNSANMESYYTGGGGGFYAFCSASIEKSLFYKNTTDGSGGGFYSGGLVDIDDSNFTQNSAYSLDNNGNYSHGIGAGFFAYGGGNIDQKHLVNNSIFVKNTAGTEGGGLGLRGKAIILNSSFLENTLVSIIYGGGGAGLFAYGVLSHCIIKDNHSNNNGGGLSFSGIVTNSVFTNNYAEKKGGAIYNYSGEINIANSIFAQNSSGISYYDSLSSVDNPHILKNNIFLDTNDSIIELTYDEYEQVVSIANNYINLDKVGVGIRAFKKNNIFENVSLGFVDEENGDYNLTSSSDLIDAGTNEYADKFIVDGVNYLVTDFADNNRSVGASMDIGIYEFTTTKPTINSFTYSGTAKQYQEITFSVDYNLSGERSIGSIEYDYTNDGTYESSNTHTFNDAKTYTVNVKVTDSSGEFSTRSVKVLIAKLPFAEMTDDQKLTEATNPTYYSDIVSIFDASVATATATGKTYVQNNLTEFSLVTQEAYNTAVSEANATGIQTGKAYVQNNPSEFSLVTQSAYNTALTDMNTTATASGIATGKTYVQNNPSEFSLVTQSAYNTALTDMNTTATASGIATGIATGRLSVINNPIDFNLTTLADMNASVATATANGIESGKQQVIASPSSFGIEVAMPLQASDITSLSAGWHMVATPLAITDMSVFDSAKIVWFYNNGVWSAYSSDSVTTSALATASIPTLSTIPVNGSVWLEK